MLLVVSAVASHLTRKHQAFILHLLISVTLISCSPVSLEVTNLRSTRAEIVGFANKLILLIRDRKLDKLAKYVHPTKGLSFSPYGHVSVNRVIVKEGELAKIWRSNPVIIWGNYDGSGQPIKMSIVDYFKTFVYAADYTSAPLTAINKRLGQGNSYSNIQEVFPNSIFVEYHFKGFEPKFQGMDWRSLILVFEKRQDKGWWLIAIINDQWTI
jgi:hypothetical protein